MLGILPFLYRIRNSHLYSLHRSITGFDAYRLSASSRIGSRGNLFLIRPANRVNALVSQSCLISSALIFSWRFRSSPLFSMNSLPILATSFSPKKIFASSTSRWYSVISLSVPLLQQRSRQCSFSFLCPQYSCVPSTMISHFFLYLASSKHRLRIRWYTRSCLISSNSIGSSLSRYSFSVTWWGTYSPAFSPINADRFLETVSSLNCSVISCILSIPAIPL